MLRFAMLLAMVGFPTLQDGPPEPPRGRQDPDEMRRHEKELSARLEELQRAHKDALIAERKDEAARIERDIAGCKQQIEDVRARMKSMKQPRDKDMSPEDRKLQQEMATLKKQLGDRELSDDERAKLNARMAEIQQEFDRRRMRGPDVAPPHPGQEFDKRLVEQTRQWATEFEPDTARRMAEMLESKRIDEVNRLANDVRRRMDEMNEMREANPEEFKRRRDLAGMERTTWSIAEKLRKAGEADRAPLKVELMASLNRLFDIREESRARELEELEQRVAELRRALEKRKENKSKIVEKRAQDMLGDEFDW